MGVVYLAGLLVALTGMVLLDRRFRFFYWSNAKRAGIVHAIGIAFFLVWDLFGIGQGLFFRGETSFMTGILLGPELPLEELFFLALLTYMTMNLFAAATQFFARREERAAAASGAPSGATDANAESHARDETS
jgi:lycopene cyclase domain-containing protein